MPCASPHSSSPFCSSPPRKKKEWKKETGPQRSHILASAKRPSPGDKGHACQGQARGIQPWVWAWVISFTTRRWTPNMFVLGSIPQGNPMLQPRPSGGLVDWRPKSPSSRLQLPVRRQPRPAPAQPVDVGFHHEKRKKEPRGVQREPIPWFDCPRINSTWRITPLG